MSEARLDFSGTFYRMPSIAPVIAVHTAVVHSRSFGHARRVRDDLAQSHSNRVVYRGEKKLFLRQMMKAQELGGM